MEPSEQAVHVNADVAPVLAWYVPIGHFLQSDRPVSSAYVPGLQSVHKLLPGYMLYEPLGQGLHDEMSADPVLGLYLPAGQSVHSGVEMTTPWGSRSAPPYLPGRHCRHAESPIVGAKVPAVPQKTQVVCPEAGWYLPTGQLMQVLPTMPPLSVYFPGAHAAQALAAVSSKYPEKTTVTGLTCQKIFKRLPKIFSVTYQACMSWRRRS